MIALGWTWPGTSPPRGLSAEAYEGLTLLCAPDVSNRSPRQIMLHQLTCLDCGLDLVPFAPAALMTRRDALGSLSSGVLATLKRIEGRVQFTLSAQMQPCSVPYGTGRDWLRARKTRRDDVSDLGGTLSRAARTVGASEINVRTKSSTLICDALIQRANQDALPGAIEKAVQGAPSRISGPLSMTGPWPAYAFVCQREDELA